MGQKYNYNGLVIITTQQLQVRQLKASNVQEHSVEPRRRGRRGRERERERERDRQHADRDRERLGETAIE